MSISPMTEDLNIIARLGDSPNTDNGLTSDGLKQKFDEAALLLQTYLNTQLVTFVNELETAIKNISDFDGSHEKLDGRDSDNQHPISAITNLGDTLGKIQNSIAQMQSDVTPITLGGTGKTTAAEALVALGAVAKAGDTMTGHLHIGTSGYPTVYFEDGEGESCGSVFASASNKRTYLRCYATDDSGFYENFRAPAANNGLTANKTYDILTTKTVTYGTKDPETAVGAAGIAGRIYFKKVT